MKHTKIIDHTRKPHEVQDTQDNPLKNEGAPEQEGQVKTSRKTHMCICGKHRQNTSSQCNKRGTTTLTYLGMQTCFRRSNT